MEKRGWITKNGRHIYIGDDGNGSGGGFGGFAHPRLYSNGGAKSNNNAESDLYRQDSSSLQRAIRKYQKRIDEHNDKISNPQKYVSDWNSYDERKKNGLIKHWKKEIQNFDVSIQRRKDELKRRGDSDE